MTAATIFPGKTLIAIAALLILPGATTFTDYFVLLKANNDWKIASKVYASRPTN